MWEFFHLEMISSWRRLGETLQIAAFYALVVLFFVMSQPPGMPDISEKTGILWASMMIIFTIVQHRMFARDFASGFLEQWRLLPLAAEWLVLLKCAVQWLIVVIPLLFLTPLLAIMLNVKPILYPYLMLTLGLGMASLVMLGSVAAAASLAFRGGEMIVVLLVLPLALPILILGSIASTKAVFSNEMLFLCGYFLLITPFAAYITARLTAYAVE
ncbi:MAG: heme exporter protein CcmB [Rickettsiales bacterium]